MYLANISNFGYMFKNHTFNLFSLKILKIPLQSSTENRYFNVRNYC